MKNFTKSLISYINQVHSYPFWLFIFFLYASILTFGASGVFSWYPNLLSNVNTSVITGEILFESAMGLLAIGFITAPIMDLILHIDIDKK